MAQEIVLKPRGTGKGAARALRRQNLVPAIIYGKSITPISVALDAAAQRRVLTGIGTQVHRVKIEGSDFEGNVMVQEAVFDPISGKPLHLDLHRISLTEKIRTEIPITITGEGALEKSGLILQRQLRQIAVECLPTDIPSSINIDVSDLAHGDTITADQVELPPDVRLVTSPSEVIVVVLAPKVAEEKADEEEAAEEAAPEAEENPEPPTA